MHMVWHDFVSFVLFIGLTRSCKNLSVNYSSLRRNWKCYLKTIVQPVRMHGYPPMMSAYRGTNQLAWWCGSRKSYIVYESSSTTTEPDLTNRVDEPKRGRKRKLKKWLTKDTSMIDKYCQWRNITMHGIIYKGSKSLRDSRKPSTPTTEMLSPWRLLLTF